MDISVWSIWHIYQYTDPESTQEAKNGILHIPCISHLKTEDMRPNTPELIHNAAKAVITRLGTVVVSIVGDDGKILHAILSYSTMLKDFTQNFVSYPYYLYN